MMCLQKRKIIQAQHKVAVSPNPLTLNENYPSEHEEHEVHDHPVDGDEPTLDKLETEKSAAVKEENSDKGMQIDHEATPSLTDYSKDENFATDCSTSETENEDFGENDISDDDMLSFKESAKDKIDERQENYEGVKHQTYSDKECAADYDYEYEDDKEQKIKEISERKVNPTDSVADSSKTEGYCRLSADTEQKRAYDSDRTDHDEDENKENKLMEDKTEQKYIMKAISNLSNDNEPKETDEANTDETPFIEYDDSDEEDDVPVWDHSPESLSDSSSFLWADHPPLMDISLANEELADATAARPLFPPLTAPSARSPCPLRRQGAFRRHRPWEPPPHPPAQSSVLPVPQTSEEVVHSLRSDLSMVLTTTRPIIPEVVSLTRVQHLDLALSRLSSHCL